MVEKEIGILIKCLRTNRGGEFNDFCEHGMKRQLTTTYTSQQNEVVKCKNRTMI